MCKAECPTQAISMGEEFYQINPNLCVECVGYYNKPTCQAVCPISNAILKDPSNHETKEQLWEKFISLNYHDKY